jgi:multiple sugar transport system ATP-binding protein
MAKLILNHVSKKFGDIVAVHDLSLEIRDGEFMVLLGPSGAGKTTTLKLIAGVERPDNGLIYLGDKIVNAIEPQNRNIAMAFETYALYPHFSVYENLAFPLRAPGRKFKGQQIDLKVRQIAELLGITPLLDRAPAHLSGGQRQRVSLGRALVRDPDVLLLDEPISHLDAKLRHRMRAEFKILSKTINTTILYVTHDYLEALSLPDRVAILDKGSLHQLGSPDEVFNHPADIFVAGLLGQPKINLFHCGVQASGETVCFTSQDGSVQLTTNHKIRERVLRADLDEVIVGIRPLHMRVLSGSEEAESGLAGTVYVYERLGTKGILTLSVGSQKIDVITPISMDFRIDEPVKIAVDIDQLHVFHATTQRNLLLD